MKLDTPYWMQTRLGQWLARHWPPLAALWRVRMQEALIREAAADELGSRINLLVAVNKLVAANQAPRELVWAWVPWRNAAEKKYQYECELTGCKLHRLELEGSPLASEEPTP